MDLPAIRHRFVKHYNITSITTITTQKKAKALLLTEGHYYIEETDIAVKGNRILAVGEIPTDFRPDTVVEGLQAGKTFTEALESREFEPDAPNFTPRISGMLTFADGDFTYQMSILKSADAAGSACNRFTYHYAPISGLGHFLHTYVCDGSPIPTFQGAPERMAVCDSIDEMTDRLWTSLNESNKISLYVRYVDLATGKTENRLVNKNR